MRNIVITILFQSLLLTGYSQDLILNGDFEDKNICTERLEACAPEAWRLTSTSFIRYHKSKENNLVEFIIHSEESPNKRSYIQSRLGDTLIIGETYRISFDISPDGLAINRIGINFTDTLIQTRSDTLINRKPTIEISDNKKLLRSKKHKHWLHIEKEFVAKEQSIYIQIGCFDSDENRLTKKIRSVTSHNSMTRRYFIDNIRLISLHNLHPQSEINCTKKIIYSQDYRHPVDSLLFTIRSTDICFHKQVTDNSPIINDTILLFGDLLFEFDSYEPSNLLFQKVDSVFKEITSQFDSIIVIGHTDNIGTKDYNDDLAFKRARSVSEYISSFKLVTDDKIIYLGKGANYPIASNNTEIGRQKNRRVEIIIKYEICR